MMIYEDKDEVCSKLRVEWACSIVRVVDSLIRVYLNLV